MLTKNSFPLCMGIAIASGVPPARGLVTGIIGGIIVGFISGSPLQVSGPAAGLAVVIADLVRSEGIEVLGAVVLLAGLIQAIAGVLKLGQIFRAISPAVIYGMMAGIGVLIFASQLQVAIDAQPYTHGIENLIAIPSVESLLSAIAVDRLHQGKRTDFDRELTAQGLGNMMCGFYCSLLFALKFS